MNFLLDTHIWLWSALDRARLSARVIHALENQENELWLSPVSLWEALMLCQKQKLILRPNPQAWITNTLDNLPMKEAFVSYEVAQETARLQLPHRDPGDRFLVATARVGGLTLITSDEAIIGARQVEVLANR
jgi:PIN domain nuclease of toxin-antitoxin system